MKACVAYGHSDKLENIGYKYLKNNIPYIQVTTYILSIKKIVSNVIP
jgi:hypothetical protein